MGTIADKLQKVIDTKEAIRVSINDKGVVVDKTIPLSQYAEKISEISSGGSGDDVIVLTTTDFITTPPVNYKALVLQYGSIVFRVGGDMNLINTFAGHSNLTSIKSVSIENTSYHFLSVQGIFSNSSKLQYAPTMDLSFCTNMSNMFATANAIIEVPAYDCSSIPENLGSALTGIFGTTLSTQEKPNFTTFGGLINVAASYAISTCPNLTVQSLLNCLNGLRNMTGKTMPQLNMGATNLAKLTPDQIAIGTNKNWTLI